MSTGAAGANAGGAADESDCAATVVACAAKPSCGCLDGPAAETEFGTGNTNAGVVVSGTLASTLDSEGFEAEGGSDEAAAKLKAGPGVADALWDVKLNAGGG